MPIQTTTLDQIGAIRRLCKAQWSLSPYDILTASPDAYGTVTGFFNKALGLKSSERDPERKAADRRQRCAVLQLFIGRPLDSFKKLTHHECEVLLNQLKAETEDGKLRPSGEGLSLIQWAADYLEDNPSLLFEENELEETQDGPQDEPIQASSDRSQQLERETQTLETETVAHARARDPWPRLSDLW